MAQQLKHANNRLPVKQQNDATSKSVRVVTAKTFRILISIEAIFNCTRILNLRLEKEVY